jgi:WD40 repeat protein
VATSSEDGCLRLFSSRGLVDHAACAADVTLQLADEAVTAVCALDRDHGLVAGTARGEAVVLDVGRLSAGNSHLSTTFDGTFVSGDAGTSPAYATLEPAAAASRLADEAVLHRLTVPGAVVNAHHAQSVAHSLVMLAAHDGNTYGYDLRAGAPVFSLPAVGGLGVAQPASGPFRGDVGALTASCMGPSQFSFLTGSQHGFVSTYDLRYAVPVSLWRTASATAVTALHAVNSTTLFPLTRGGNIVHSAANPLVVVSSEYCNEVAAYDVASGLCRSILRATDPYRRVHPPAAPDRPGATAVEDLLGPRNYSRYHSVNGGLDYSGYYTVPFHRPNPAHYGLGYPMALVSCHDLLLQSYAPTPQQLFAGTTSLNYHLPTAPLPPSSLVQPASLSSFAYLPGAAVITAGSDRSLRYWNLREPHKSYRVSSATEARRLRYTSHSVTTEWENGELTAMVAVQEHEEPSPAAGHGRDRGQGVDLSELVQCQCVIKQSQYIRYEGFRLLLLPAGRWKGCRMMACSFCARLAPTPGTAHSWSTSAVATPASDPSVWSSPAIPFLVIPRTERSRSAATPTPGSGRPRRVLKAPLCASSDFSSVQRSSRYWAASCADCAHTSVCPCCRLTAVSSSSASCGTSMLTCTMSRRTAYLLRSTNPMRIAA